MESKSVSRRSFIGKTALTAGFSALGAGSMYGKPDNFSPSPSSQERGVQLQGRLPREVWIATVSQSGISADTPAKMVKLIFPVLEKCIVYRPDIICLPEVFMYNWVRPDMNLLKEAALAEELLQEFKAFARTNQCYMICPILTAENGKIYNSAVVIDRQGNRMGEYRKIYLPDDEVKLKITPGPLQPPIFKADFGIFGIQICYDINWRQGWESLRQQGAEIVFWPSAFPGGQMINAKAWQNKYVVVSSTRDRSKICDISGEEIAQTGAVGDRNFICAPVNLEKIFLHSWPFSQRFDEIKAKYGRKVRIINYHEEQWSIIESLSPDVRVKDILAEFELRTFEQLIHDSEIKNVNIRG